MVLIISISTIPLSRFNYCKIVQIGFLLHANWLRQVVYLLTSMIKMANSSVEKERVGQGSGRCPFLLTPAAISKVA